MSQKGLGAALLQDGRPIAYASRSLSDTEQRYAQIEKEMLAIVFALEKFNQYTFGRHVRVSSDHKPLESIPSKPLAVAPGSGSCPKKVEVEEGNIFCVLLKCQ